MAVTDFMEDYLRSLRWYMDPANHAKAVQVVAQFTKLPAGSLDSWLFTDKDYYREPNGVPDIDSLQKSTRALKELGFIKADLDMTTHSDLTLIREAIGRVR